MRDFFDELWADAGGLYGEFRFIGGGGVTQAFFQLPLEHDYLEDILATHEMAGDNAYFGVLPRVRKGGKAEDTVDTTNVLWADVDAKQFTGGKASALSYVNDFPVPPSVIVDSGGGYHAYWFLDSVWLHELTVPAMKYIASQMRGDAVHDRPRVLRVPGSINFKREPLQTCRLLKFDVTRRYALSDITSLIPIQRERPRSTVARARVDDLPDWLEEIVQLGAPEGQRSEACFRVMLWLARYGRSEQEIHELFMSNPDGIGQKMAEKGVRGGDRWFDLTYRAALEVS